MELNLKTNELQLFTNALSILGMNMVHNIHNYTYMYVLVQCTCACRNFKVLPRSWKYMAYKWIIP